MKGLEISETEYMAILKDLEWKKLLLFDNDGNTFIDLKKYSKLGYYLPIKSEHQSYLVGFNFVDKLYSCPYRTQSDLVCIFPKKPKIYKTVTRTVRIPIFEETRILNEGESAECSTVNHKYREVEEIKELK
jgi:hypothetical protein